VDDVLLRLAAPFSPDAVQWRVTVTSKDKSKGMVACYIDARDVMRRLDETMGADWADEIIVQSSGLVTCRIGLYIAGEWRWRQDATAAVREVQTDGELNAKQEQERDMAQKGAASDAFKRAGVKWGIGRYLYAIPSPWVAINQYRQIEPGELPKLRTILERHHKQHAASHSTAPPPMASNGHDVGPPPADDDGWPGPQVQPSAAQPASSPGAHGDMDARTRIRILLDGAETEDDVARIINAKQNLEALRSMSEPLRVEMRALVEQTRARVRRQAPAYVNGAAA
jgi:hypothetical protein